MENYCKPSKPTPSELKLRNILRSRKIPFKYDQVIWYTIMKIYPRFDNRKKTYCGGGWQDT